MIPLPRESAPMNRPIKVFQLNQIWKFLKTNPISEVFTENYFDDLSGVASSLVHTDLSLVHPQKGNDMGNNLGQSAVYWR